MRGHVIARHVLLGTVAVCCWRRGQRFETDGTHGAYGLLPWTARVLRARIFSLLPLYI